MKKYISIVLIIIFIAALSFMGISCKNENAASTETTAAAETTVASETTASAETANSEGKPGVDRPIKI